MKSIVISTALIVSLCNIPNKEICEKDCCCEWDHAMGYIEYLKSHGTKILDVQAEDATTINDKSKLVVLHAQKTGKYDINDTSIILLWKIGAFRVLFSGDLNWKLGQALKNHPNIQADILKVPHHGTESLASNAFIQNVSAKVMVIPSTKSLWASDRSKRIRTFKVDCLIRVCKLDRYPGKPSSE